MIVEQLCYRDYFREHIIIHYFNAAIAKYDPPKLFQIDDVVILAYDAPIGLITRNFTIDFTEFKLCTEDFCMPLKPGRCRNLAV